MDKPSLIVTYTVCLLPQTAQNFILVRPKRLLYMAGPAVFLRSHGETCLLFPQDYFAKGTVAELQRTVGTGINRADCRCLHGDKVWCFLYRPIFIFRQRVCQDQFFRRTLIVHLPLNPYDALAQNRKLQHALLSFYQKSLFRFFHVLPPLIP